MMLRIGAIGVATVFGRGLNGLAQAISEDRLPFVRRRDFLGSDFRPQLMALSPEPIETRTLSLRLLDLLDQSLADLGSRWDRSDWPETAPLVSLPARDGSHHADATEHDVRTALSDRLGVAIPSDAIACGGAGGFATLLERAEALVRDGKAVLLICVDSWNQRDRLLHQLDQQALFSRANPYGFIPGEAAVAMLLLPETVAPERAVGIIAGHAGGDEPAPEIDNADSDFSGLSDAAHAALDAAGIRPSVVASDWNNSRYRASELSYCLLRIADRLNDAVRDPEYAALRHGETGAAAPALAIAQSIAMEGVRDIIVMSGNRTDGRRSAVVARTIGGSRREGSSIHDDARS